MKNVKIVNSWIARRANHIEGFYLEPFEDGIKLGRSPSDSFSNEISAVTLIKNDTLSNTVSLILSCGPESVGLIKWVTIECFSVGENYKLLDPFKLSPSNISESTLLEKTPPYKIPVGEINKKIVIKGSFEFLNLVIRIKVMFLEGITSRLSDYIKISDLKCYNTNGDNLHDLISVNNINEDIITPNVRLIRCAKSTKLTISFTPVNFPKNKYNTLDLFHGLQGSRLFINDSNSQWYANGVCFLGTTINEVNSSIDKIITAINAKHVTTFGTSMGAYGAILIGCLINSEHIIAFNPELTLFSDSSRSSTFIRNKHHQFDDLIPMIENNRNRIDLFFSIYDPIDSLMLKHSKQISKENLYIYEIESKHNIGDVLNTGYYWLSSLVEHAAINSSLLPSIIRSVKRNTYQQQV